MREYKNNLRMKVCALKRTIRPPDLNPTPGYDVTGVMNARKSGGVAGRKREAA